MGSGLTKRPPDGGGLRIFFGRWSVPHAANASRWAALAQEKNMANIPFEKSEVKAYLDRCIVHWRNKRDKENDKQANYYIDAFQSVRETLFGETLPPNHGVHSDAATAPDNPK